MELRKRNDIKSSLLSFFKILSFNTSMDIFLKFVGSNYLKIASSKYYFNSSKVVSRVFPKSLLKQEFTIRSICNLDRYCELESLHTNCKIYSSFCSGVLLIEILIIFKN